MKEDSSVSEGNTEEGGEPESFTDVKFEDI